jgi:hypothetical protein
MKLLVAALTVTVALAVTLTLGSTQAAEKRQYVPGFEPVTPKAQQPGGVIWDDGPPFHIIVARCAGEIRARTPGSRFDAYVPPTTEAVSFFGTDEERFQLRKCLAMKGTLLESDLKRTPR